MSGMFASALLQVHSTLPIALSSSDAYSLQPLDVLRTRMQQVSDVAVELRLATDSNRQPKQAASLLSQMGTIYRSEGNATTILGPS